MSNVVGPQRTPLRQVNTYTTHAPNYSLSKQFMDIEDWSRVRYRSVFSCHKFVMERYADKLFEDITSAFQHGWVYVCTCATL
jgi:hypothetical protein